MLKEKSISIFGTDTLERKYLDIQCRYSEKKRISTHDTGTFEIYFSLFSGRITNGFCAQTAFIMLINSNRWNRIVEVEQDYFIIVRHTS